MNHRSQPCPSRSPELFRAALNARLHRDEGLRCALIALNCYRTRHVLADYRRSVATARSYVACARRAGFRGSVNRILGELATGGAR